MRGRPAPQSLDDFLGIVLTAFRSDYRMSTYENASWRRLPPSPCRAAIYENECEHSCYVCERARYVPKLQLRASWHLHAHRARDGALPDDDDARRHGGERPPGDDAHPLDVSVTVPFGRASSE
jgi:hypothetical protein